jgi:predicted DNA-binding ribbon-helix-helix protein
MSACQREADWPGHFKCDVFGVTFQVGQMMKKRSLSIKGHMTSISLEDAFWAELGRIADERGVSVARLVGEIDSERVGGLSSAIRLFVLEVVKNDRGKNDGASGA